MTELTTRDVEYTHDDTRMIGLLVAPAGASSLPTVVLFHDAFGISEYMIEVAHRIAALGYSVFAADVWGDRTLPTTQAEIGPLIGGMVADRDRWLSRARAALDAAAAQPEVHAAQVAVLGYCFGGATALELARTGSALAGVIAIHPGLDLVEFDWSAGVAGTRALVSLGADDPMATPEQWRQTKAGMDAAEVDWELDLYSGTVHAFTSPNAANSPNPAVIQYHPRNAERARVRTDHFIQELFADRVAAKPTN